MLYLNLMAALLALSASASASAAVARAGRRQIVTTTEPLVMIEPTESPCVAYFPSIPKVNLGPVRTVYPATVTTTTTVNCGICTAAEWYGLIGPGPVVRFTTTTTMATPSVVTELKC